MNDIRTIDLTRALPHRLKQDETMLALANVIAPELQKNAINSRLATIYARIDELAESILDILAYDLHVDWYNYSDPVDAKRAVIKSSVKVHKRLGTKFAVETALGALHPGTYIEEWFEYGGTPHYFRVILDVTYSRVAASHSRLAKEINFYKRLTSKLESLVYQTTVIIETAAEGRAFPYRAGLTGLYNAGTEPQRAIVGALGTDGVTVDLEAGGFNYRARAAGTEPQRAVVGVLAGDEIGAFIDGLNFPYAAGMTGKYNAGEEPQRSTVTVLTEENINAAIEGQGFLYSVPPAGTGNAGTEPQRADAAGIETSNIVQTVTAEGYGYTAKHCGTSRCK
jgi:phage tail P2-like protein